MSDKDRTDRDRIEADIVRTRAELRATADELSERLDPRTQVEHVVEEAKLALADAKRRVTGEVRPADEPEPTRTGWIALGAAAAAGLLVVGTVIRKL